MKLLLYSHYFAPSVGGVETITLSLSRGLAELRDTNGQRQFDVTVVTRTARSDFDDRSLPFAMIRRPGISELWRLIRATDVIHLAGPSLLPLVLAWIARKPVLIEHHGYQAICPNGLLVHQPDRSVCPGHFQAARYWECLRCQAVEVGWWRSFAKLVEMFSRNFLCRKAARNIAISSHVSERHALPGSCVVYYGIEDLPASDIKLPEAASPGLREVCFAYVGRLVPEKGLPVLIQAAEIVRREGHAFKILLVGDGPERQMLESLAEQKGLRDIVQCTGFLQGAALGETLRRVHVVVMPSAWEETAGLAAIEQMMRGRPVIASRIGGLGEVVGDAALTCEPGSPDDLALRMKEILQDPGKIQMIGAAARDRARVLFLRGRMIAEHAELYRSVFQESGHPLR